MYFDCYSIKLAQSNSFQHLWFDASLKDRWNNLVVIYHCGSYITLVIICKLNKQRQFTVLTSLFLVQSSSSSHWNEDMYNISIILDSRLGIYYINIIRYPYVYANTM